ncbi:hypothetical protein [Streptomyces canus]|uniref:hypothetical protein n=1 Tax=Streptomyces canus TaxID=58343 RepID=UPI0003706F8F|nr:hypothetical protein [Streptomyces canus]
MSDDEEYQDKSPAAARMGKAAEYLVAASSILATDGELNVSTSLVDDEGVDLVFHRRGSTATLAVQVKARMSTGVLVRRGTLMAFVRSQTFQPRSDLDMLFVAVDVEQGAICHGSQRAAPEKVTHSPQELPFPSRQQRTTEHPRPEETLMTHNGTCASSTDTHPRSPEVTHAGQTGNSSRPRRTTYDHVRSLAMSTP